MEGEKFPKRIRLGFAALVALIASLAFMAAASTAAAQGSPVTVGDGRAIGTPERNVDPMNTNIPYLAWRGEQLRLVKCLRGLANGVSAQQVLNVTSRVSLIVEDFSGPDPGGNVQAVNVIPGTERLFIRTDPVTDQDELCFSGAVVSLKPGLAQIKLVWVLDVSIPFQGGIDQSVINLKVLEHQFLVAWMNILDVRLFEVNRPDLGDFNSAAGATEGTGRFEPICESTGLVFDEDLWEFFGGPTSNIGRALPPICDFGPGELQAFVRGSIPLGANYTELGLGASLTMPDDWERLARRFARDFTLQTREDWRTWDIHDQAGFVDGGSPDIHPAGTPASCGPSAVRTDQVDNCPAPATPLGAELGPFSTTYLDQVANAPVIGPFDPVYHHNTMLSDGNLDASDAPMPSTYVEFAIAPNTGGTDIGGIGAFSTDASGTVDKCDVYSKPATAGPFDTRCERSGRHAIYAPYYQAYIPAVARNLLDASGTDTALITNNFPGYEPGIGLLYNYWDTFTLSEREGTSECLTGEFTLDDFLGLDRAAMNAKLNQAKGTIQNHLGVFEPEPTGADVVFAYTDEHGEVRVRWDPDTGIFAGANQNNACFLTGVIGTASITATARYPYQLVTAADVTSAPELKQLIGIQQKTITCVPKTPASQAAIAAFCTARAVDFRGNPFVFEEVCVVANPDASVHPLRLDPFGFEVSDNKACSFTNIFGEAYFDVVSTPPNSPVVNVEAYFVDEGIFEDTQYTFPRGATTPPGGGTTPPGGGTTPPGGGPAPVVSLGGNVTPTAPTAPSAPSTPAAAPAKSSAAPSVSSSAAKLTIRSARLVVTKAGRYLLVRVDGNASTAKIRISLIGRNGKVLRVVTRSVPTNRLVQVKSLKLSKSVRSARVALA